MKHFLKLIRINNLLIILLTQYAMRYALILPILKIGGFESQLGELNFFLMALSTMLLTASGYVINDYFDIKTDTINRPERLIVGKHIKRRTAMIMHIALSILGILLGFYLAYQTHFIKLGYIYLFIAAMLWYYSAVLDKKYLAGNILVACMAALVPLMTIVFEIPSLYHHYGQAMQLLGKDFNNIIFLILGFTGFAFITTLVREIIKDTEDFEGDSAFGRQTLPVVSGIKISKIVIIFLIIFTIGSIIFVFFNYLFCLDTNTIACLKYDYISLVYILIFLISSNLFLIFKVIKAKTQQNWHNASTISKFIMLFGVLYSSIIFYNLNN